MPTCSIRASGDGMRLRPRRSARAPRREDRCRAQADRRVRGRLDQSHIGVSRDDSSREADPRALRRRVVSRRRAKAMRVRGSTRLTRSTARSEKAVRSFSSRTVSARSSPTTTSRRAATPASFRSFITIGSMAGASDLRRLVIGGDSTDAFTRAAERQRVDEHSQREGWSGRAADHRARHS